MRYPAGYNGPQQMGGMGRPQQMGGGFNPFMGGGFNPFMGGISNFGGFNPFMGLTQMGGGQQPQLQGPNNMPGNQVPGGGGMPRTMDFRDSNNDGVDDRDQNSGSGGPQQAVYNPPMKPLQSMEDWSQNKNFKNDQQMERRYQRYENRWNERNDQAQQPQIAPTVMPQTGQQPQMNYFQMMQNPFRGGGFGGGFSPFGGFGGGFSPFGGFGGGINSFNSMPSLYGYR
jgi:hypothetical protein